MKTENSGPSLNLGGGGDILRSHLLLLDGVRQDMQVGLRITWYCWLHRSKYSGYPKPQAQQSPELQV